jgi:hypothetical protein
LFFEVLITIEDDVTTVGPERSFDILPCELLPGVEALLRYAAPKRKGEVPFTGGGEN